jgi:hypothetical protein
MAALELTPDQVKLIADELSLKVYGTMEGADEGSPQEVIDAYDEVTPTVELLREILGTGKTTEYATIKSLAGSIRSERFEEVGRALDNITRMEAGEILFDPVSQEEALEQQIQFRDTNTAEAKIAGDVWDAAWGCELEVEAAAGDKIAGEILRRREKRQKAVA